MAAPSEAWTDISIDQWTSKTPLRASLVDAWRTNQEHLKEIAYGTSISYGGGSAHAHTGSDSASVGVVDCNNLIPSGYHMGTSWLATTPWVRSGFSGATGTAYMWDFSGTVYGQLSGNNLYQIVGGTATKSLGLFGSNGADLVASIWVRSHLYDNPVGQISFGFADGGTSFASGFQADVPAASIPLQWKRFYARFSGVGAGFSTDVRFLVRVTTSFSPGKVAFGGGMLNLGTVLAPSNISNIEQRNIPNVRYMQLGHLPIFELEASMHDAVDVTP